MADAISRLDFTKAKFKAEQHQNWTILTKRWCEVVQPTQQFSKTKHTDLMNQVFANPNDKEEIYPLTVKEFAEAQKKEKAMDKLKVSEKYKVLLIENTHVLCKDGKLVIPKSLQHQAVSWYHH